MKYRKWLAFLLPVLSCASALGQQPAESSAAGPIQFNGSIRSRVETWKWFVPDSGDNSYTFVGNTIRFGLSQRRKQFDWSVELEAPLLLHLPTGAIAPGNQGQLGQGANYFSANHQSNPLMIFPKQAFLRWRDAGASKTSIRFGRLEFQDGGESPSKLPSLTMLKQDRIQQRLIGPFGFTHVMRSFDGVHLEANRHGIQYTLLAAMPTRGVFQVDAWGWTNVALAYGSAMGKFRRKSIEGEWRVFAIGYSDWRRIPKADNQAPAIRANDLGPVKIGTYGGHWIGLHETHYGTFDFLGEFALQNGSWGTLTHSAAMFDIETGWQIKAFWKVGAWLRGGYYYGSGDGQPGDGRHGTFFQILPTARPYAQLPFYNMMNNVDRFVTFQLRPHKRLSFKPEVHFLRLASRTDNWYLGGGAYQPWTFGYTARSGGGALGLANLFSFSAEIRASQRLTLSPYFGFARGKSVVQTIYPRGSNGRLAFVEFNYRY